MADEPGPREAILGSGAGGPLTAPGPWIMYPGYIEYDGGIVNGAGLTSQGAGSINSAKLFVNGTQVSPSLYFPYTGGTFTGYVTLIGNPTSPLHAATKQYVDTAISTLTSSINTSLTNYLLLTGGTLTGPLTTTSTLTLSANPTAALQAATKQYVDTGISTLSSSINTSLNNYLLLAGGTLTGPLVTTSTLTLSANPTAALQAAPKQYVDTNITNLTNTMNSTFANYLPLAGGTLTGPLTTTSTLTLSADPTVALQAATKQYVDNKTAGTIGIPDAPNDGNLYGRQSAAWAVISLDAGTY